MPRAATIVDQTPELLMWLFQRHLEAGMDAQNVASMEAGLAREGLLPPRPAQPQAIAFVDLAGYTRLTEAGGDELAARSAARACRARRRGRSARTAAASSSCWATARCFTSATRAVPFARPWTSIDAIADAGLPPGHAGISAGPLVGRDGDYFGHTVNVAASLSGRARAGVILATGEVNDAVGEAADGVRFEPVGEVALKNVARRSRRFGRSAAGRPAAKRRRRARSSVADAVDEGTEAADPPASPEERGKTVHGEAANAGHRVLAPDDAEVEAYLETALHAPAPDRTSGDAGPGAKPARSSSSTSAASSRS